MAKMLFVCLYVCTPMDTQMHERSESKWIIINIIRRHPWLGVLEFSWVSHISYLMCSHLNRIPHIVYWGGVWGAELLCHQHHPAQIHFMSYLLTYFWDSCHMVVGTHIHANIYKQTQIDAKANKYSQIQTDTCKCMQNTYKYTHKHCVY